MLLIGSVLLQPGKTDAGALFTSNISSTAFQPRGAQTILSKITIGAATVFMLSALFLAMPALTGDISVLQTTSEISAESSAPVANTATDANTNTVGGNSNVTVESNTAVVVDANGADKVNVVPANTNSAANK